MSSVLKMPLLSLLFSFLFVNSCIAGYVIEDDYSLSSFFDMFSFWTEQDPTNGFVDYIDRSSAESGGLIGTADGNIYIGTDHDNVTPNGRPSIRLTSNKAYNVGSLVILDIAHMPGGICGTWPAFWMVGPNWPSGGEIDILEGVNEQSTNAMTLHTDPGCSITNDGNFSGSISTYSCDVNASGQTANAGCSIDSSDTQTYGTDFNSNGGGVYATEWTNTSISIWFFPRSSIPEDLSGDSPNPSSWGQPTAQFQGGCDIPQYFQDLQIVFDLTFCGSWAGDAWSSSSCSSKADTCVDYVRDNPQAFSDAYWTINSLRAFQYNAAASYSTSSPGTSSTSAGSTPSVAVSTSTQAQTQTQTQSPSSVWSSVWSSEETEAPSSSSNQWGWGRPSGSAGFNFALNKAVEHASSTGTAYGSATQVASSPNATGTTTLSVQAKIAHVQSNSTVSAASTVALSTSAPSAANDSISSAVPTSQAEMMAKAEAMVKEWSTTQPENWQDKINAFEEALKAASSQAAAVSARLSQNQKRHMAHHRRFSGHY